jgi:hypothetical protein
MMNSFAAAESTDTTLSDESGILPVEFYQGRRDAGEDGPTRRLMTAILVDAIHCYQAGAGRGWRDQDAAEARSWMFGIYPEFLSHSPTYVLNSGFLQTAFERIAS